MRYNSIMGVAFTAFSVFSSGCGPSEEAEWFDPMARLPNHLVVVFQEEADPGEILSFLEEHTFSSTPHPEIGGVVRIDVQGHVAYEIGLWPNVTVERIAAISEELAASSLVYGIYENVDPAEIVLE